MTSVVPAFFRSMSSSRSADRVLRRRAVDPVHLRHEHQRLLRGQPIEQREILGDDADAALDGDRIGERIDAEDAHRAAARACSRPVRHLIVVDLPAPFGPEEAVEAAGRHGQIDAVDRAEAAEVPRQAVRLDGEFHARILSPAYYDEPNENGHRPRTRAIT